MKVRDALSFHHLQVVKKEMQGKSKFDKICNKDLRKMQHFMIHKSLENSRLEVLLLTNMVDTRTTMKGKYKEPYNYPHRSDGLEAGTLESPLLIMNCRANEEFRQGIDPELDQKERPG